LQVSGERRRHAPDNIADVIGHKQSPGRISLNPDGAAHGLAIGIEEAGQDVTRQTDPPAIDKGHRDNLVATARFAIPGTVLADDGGVAPGRDQ